MKIIIRLHEYMAKHPHLAFFFKYAGLFTLLLLSLASMALYNIISTESNPFFYANF